MHIAHPYSHKHMHAHILLLQAILEDWVVQKRVESISNVVQKRVQTMLSPILNNFESKQYESN